MMVPPEPPVPMMEPPTPPSFSANEEAGPVKTAQKRFTIPSLPPVGFRFDPDVPIVKGSGDHKQIFQFSIDLFRDDEGTDYAANGATHADATKRRGTINAAKQWDFEQYDFKRLSPSQCDDRQAEYDHKQIFNFPSGLFR